MERFQGEDIPFNIELFSDANQENPISIDGLNELLVYVFTDGCLIDKLSKTTKAGYSTLKRNTAYQYVGIVDSEKTKLMQPGTLFMEINIVYQSEDVNDGNLNIIRRSSIGILRKSTIKSES